MHGMRVWLVAAFVCAAASSAVADKHPLLAEVDAYISGIELDRDAENWRFATPPPPALSVPEGERALWILETSAGVMRFELFHDIAPNHVSNTIYLSRLGFYDGLHFHRIVGGFVAQSGSPDGSLSGGPAYRFASEISKTRRGRHRRKGILSAAPPKGRHDYDGSQFFITLKASPSLDGDHTVYGGMLDGKKVLRALDRAGTPSGRPLKKISILSARIEMAPVED